MKIAPITNNRINNNVSHKAELTDVAKYILTVQSAMYKNPLYGEEAKPAKINKFLSFSFILDKSCRDLFKGKSKSQILNIRNKYKVMAEENSEKLKTMLKELFPDNCYFSFNKKEDNKFHAVMLSASNWYEHDFGPMNFSEKHNSFSDIESVRELVERIKNLSQKEIAEINKKLKHKPIEPPPDKPIDPTGAALIIMMA
jgi:hypothetical protein